MKRALIIVDLQRDFCPGGALAVEEGDLIVEPVNRLAPGFDIVVATRDWHPANHVSFASSHPGRSIQETVDADGIAQVLWPDHCVQNSQGASFHPDFDPAPLDLILHKGTQVGLDSYSAFFENDHATPTGLEGYLRGRGVGQLFVCGLATDYCVFFSVMDALKLDFPVTLLTDCVRGVDFPQGNVAQRLQEMEEQEAVLIESDALR